MWQPFRSRNRMRLPEPAYFVVTASLVAAQCSEVATFSLGIRMTVKELPRNVCLIILPEIFRRVDFGETFCGSLVEFSSPGLVEASTVAFASPPRSFAPSSASSTVVESGAVLTIFTIMSPLFLSKAEVAYRGCVA